MQKQVELWQRSELTDVTAKVVIYEAFVEGKLEAPKYLARTVHDLYFGPEYEEFKPSAYSDDVDGRFQRDVNGHSGHVNKVGAQRRWDYNHARHLRD